MTDSVGITEWTYDALNRVTSVTDPFGETVQYAYDAAGNQAALIYPDGTQVDYAYDEGNRLTNVNSQSAVTSYKYDSANRLTLVSRPNNVDTAYAYDAADRLLSITHAQGVELLSSFEYTYDKAGNRLQVVEDIKNPVPPTPTPTFTPTNTSTPTDTPTSTPTNTPTPTATFTAGEAVQDLQYELDSYVDSGGVDENLQNSLSSKLEAAQAGLDDARLTSAVNQLEAFINAVEAQRGKKISEEAAEALIAAAQLIIAQIGLMATPTDAIVPPTGTLTPTETMTPTEDLTTSTALSASPGPLSSPTGAPVGEGSPTPTETITPSPTATETPDLPTPLSFNGPAVFSVQYFRPQLALLAPKTPTFTVTATPTVTDTPTMTPTATETSTATVTSTSTATHTAIPIPPEPVTIDYLYDPLYRLTEANYSTGDYYHYTYDSVGNRLTEESKIEGLLSAVDYAYDEANRLTSVDNVAYTWDANGNLLNDGVNTYTYDSANRLTSVLGPPSSVQYTYNGLGDRLTQNGVQYTLDLNSGLTQVLDDGEYNYLYGNGRISQTGTSTEYFLGDALGSVRQLTNDAAEITLTKAYEPYGEEAWSYGEGLSAFAFTGEARDSYIKLIYLRSRMYSPGTGRFLTKDSWPGNYNRPLSLNRWNYVEGNPVNHVDPSGHITEKESKRADLILEKLNDIYNVQIKKDWGYLNDLFYVSPSLRTWSDCQWVEGNWRSLQELELTLEAVKDMTQVLGGKKGLFSTAMRWHPVRLYRIESDYISIGDNDYGGYSLNNIILPNNAFDSTDGWAKGTIVHEFAHVIDYRQWWPPFRLSNGMAVLTKSFKDGVYDPTGEAAPSDYAQSHPREDWAESFKYYVYPSFGYLSPIRKNYIENAIKNYWVP